MLGSLVGTDPLSTDSSAIQNDHELAEFDPGQLYSDKKGRIYRYVRVEDADLVEGDIVYPASTDGTEVTRDVSGGSRIGATAAGIALNAVSDGNYCWVQISGVGAVAIALNSGDVSAGDSLVPDTSNDGKMAAMSAGEEDHVFGTALDASSSSTLAAGAYRLHGML